MNKATQSIDGHCLISGLDSVDTATVRLAAGLGLADLAVEASDCGQYLMLMCGETLVALVGATGSDVEAVEFADGGRYRVEDLMEMVTA